MTVRKNRGVHDQTCLCATPIPDPHQPPGLMNLSRFFLHLSTWLAHCYPDMSPRSASSPPAYFTRTGVRPGRRAHARRPSAIRRTRQGAPVRPRRLRRDFS